MNVFVFPLEEFHLDVVLSKSLVMVQNNDSTLTVKKRSAHAKADRFSVRGTMLV